MAFYGLIIPVMLVASYLVGKLAERIRLPGLLGMLISGILIGPSVLGILSDDFLQLMPTISVIALITVIVSSFFAIDVDVLRDKERSKEANAQ
jgi:predicted Kef-type K+ transport protein